MAVCSFDMRFTYVLAGWEGTAHYARVFNAAINMPNSNFPTPPHGKINHIKTCKIIHM